MKLRGYGEDRLVAELLDGLAAGKQVIVGAGDDCAVVGRRSAKKWLLLKTDCIVEDVHFTGRSDPFQIGWKAAARAISDIAAMGGLPQHALVTVAASPEMEVAFLKAIYRGLDSAVGKFGAAIVGGETSRSPSSLFISVALTGEVESGRCVTRSGGKAGDALFVTGQLGGSLRGRHLTFIPRVNEARWLTKHFPIRAMMDLSDGLGADLPRLAKASAVSFEIEELSLPLTPGSAAQNAIGDGEDYELLFSISSSHSQKLLRAWRRKFPKLPLTEIGKLVRRASDGTSNTNGFDHFA
ncbi:MAG: thiamine-monophosphate kinase [Chthoniobacter sp.]|jgi:thiamine-monophosphate kinase|nr:thiamine-monophosphate kinase [Chthoniobacter sp.]